MKKWGVRWLLAAAPGLLGLGIYLLIGNSSRNTIYALTISLNFFPLLIGTCLTFMLAAALFVWQRQDKQRQEALIAQKAETDANHRRFLQRLDHELKNPLTAIRFGLENVSTAQDGDKTAALASVNAQANRLIRLTADMRKLAEIDTQPLEKSEVDLSQLLQEAVDLINDQPHAQDRKINLVVPQAPWPLPTIAADWDLIFLAVYNLLENAIKFSGPGDMVEVRAREANPHVVIEVADTGPGIDEADFDHVWEELYRGFRTRSVTGSGLGLPLVKAIVERHGGSVLLDSRTEQGTVFSLQLPI